MTDFFDEKRILITGASGVIGTNFLRSLNNIPTRDSVIMAIHNRPLPTHLEDLKNSSKFKFISMDLTDSDNLKNLPKADIIIHAATLGQPNLFLANKLDTMKLNTTALFALLNRLAEGGTLLFISTSEVYNGLTTIPFREEQIGTSTPEHPRACYIESKRCGEAICLSSGKNVKIIRASLIYGLGTRVDDGRVLYEFINQALTKGEIVVKGSMDNIRTYCYAEDAVDMMWNVVVKGKQVIYNVGGDSSMSISELAKMIATVTNAKLTFAEGEGLIGAPSAVQVDMGRYNNEFGKYKYTPFPMGLDIMIRWQKQILL